MFKTIVEQSRAVSKMWTNSIADAKTKAFVTTWVDVNHDFGSAVAEASDNFLTEVTKLAGK